MRVLQLAPPWFAVPPAGYGGIEWIVACLADGLADAGHDVALLASGGSRTRARLESVFDEPPSERLGETFVEVIHALHGYDRRADYDLVHDHCGAVGIALSAVSDGPPGVHTLHGPWTQDTTRLYRMLSDRVHLVAISHDQARRAPDGVRIAGVVHNGIPVEHYPLRTDKDDFLLFIGRANHEKGPAVAAQVAARLGRRLVMAVKINEPPERRYWDEVVAPHLDGVDVEVVGQLDAEHKADLLGRAAAVLFPIQWPEPFGLVMAEANACGTPVVAFADGAAPEVLADDVSGVLVAPGDLDGFTAAVARAEKLDPAACRAHAVEFFSAERMVAGYERLYGRMAVSR